MSPSSPDLPGPPSGAGYFARGYFATDTIAAISSGLGGAIAIVRVSGPRANELLARLTAPSPPSTLASPASVHPATAASLAASAAESSGITTRFPHRAMVRTPLFSATGEPLDDAVAARFQGPQSYTGEDLLELHVHGSSFIAHRMLEELVAAGARPAKAGEFSFRAVRNGKLSITQAQAVSDLISAQNEDAVTLALEKLSGTQNRLIRELAESLKHLAVLSEAGIDFADQDIEEVSLPALKVRARAVISRLTALQASYARGLRLQDGVAVAFVGLPNAGKSSFFNAVLGEDRAIVSDQPGTTRDILRERITLRSGVTGASASFRLHDTAGLRATQDAIEKQGIARTGAAAREADIAVLLVEPGSAVEAVGDEWLKLGVAPERTLGILTKADLLEAFGDRGQETERLQAIGGWTWLQASSLTGEGVGAAIDAMVGLAARETRREPGEILLTRLDQVNAIHQCVAHLSRALGCPQEDLFASDLRQALFALSPLIGETLPDDVLGTIFSDFCIGK